MYFTIMRLLQSTLNHVCHLFYPHTCNACGSDVISNNHLLCLHCLHDLPVTNFFSKEDNPVKKIFYGRLPIIYAAAGYFFTKQSALQHLLIELKYRGNKDIGNYMGQLLGQLIVESPDFSSVDALIPLPLNPRKQKKRGYNQATALCNGISAVTNIPVIDNAVIRKVYTETQTHMGRINRWENMDGVFAIKDDRPLENKHLLLVDDVVTTGATLEACGGEMLKVSGTSLSIATLAYTI
jgi:ComF family protein